MLQIPERRLFNSSVHEDPMAGSANIVDAMLVLSVGFLIFLVLSWNIQSVVFADMTVERKGNNADHKIGCRDLNG